MFAVSPTFAIAADVPRVAICGTQSNMGVADRDGVASNKYYLVDSDGALRTDGATESNYNIYYDEASNKLAINNLTLEAEKYLFVPGGTTVEVLGTNSLAPQSDATSGGGIGVVTDGDLAIEGTGSLYIKSREQRGIFRASQNNAYNKPTTNGGIEIHGAVKLTVDQIGQLSCIRASSGEDVTIGGTASVKLNSNDSSSISDVNGGNITIKDAATVTSNGSIDTTGQKDGVYGKVIVGGKSSLTMTDTDTNDRGIWLRGDGGLEIAKNATVNISSNTQRGQAVAAQKGEIDVAGQLTVTMTNQNPSGNAALYARDMRITGSLSVTGGVNGLYLNSGNAIVFDGADVKITDCYLGVPFPADITNSQIEIDAEAKAFSNKPVVKLDNGYELYAGVSKEQAEKVALDKASLGTWQKKYVKVAEHPHQFTQKVASDTYRASAATCTESARYYYSCTCGKAGTETFAHGNPLGHSLTKTEKVEPTCTAAGKEAYFTCERCGKHFEDAAGQSEISDIGGYGVIAPVGHQLWRVAAKAPTASEPGNIEYRICSACDKLFTDETATVETTLDKTVIPATGEEPIAQFTVWVIYGNGQPDGKFEIMEGEKLARPADPEPLGGYEFVGWFTVKNGDNTLSGAYDFNDPVIGDLTIYAGWTPVDSKDEEPGEPIVKPGEDEEPAEKPNETQKSADKPEPALPQTGDVSALPMAAAAGAGVITLAAGVIALERRQK